MHWTYAARPEQSDLEQGDFLFPDDGLRSLLDEEHPRFNSEKIIGFVVSTQSCDLVRRNGKPPKAGHINILAVRSLKESLPNLIESCCRQVGRGIFLRSDRGRAKDLLTRIFNQNEQALGLFYFHPDADLGIGDHSVAYLRIAVALDAKHYDALLQARRGGLDPAFQAKFGWLVGNLYSRAATPDWSDRDGGGGQLKDLVETHLQEQIAGLGPHWIDDELVDVGKKQGVIFDNRSFGELSNELEACRPPPPIDKLIAEIEGEVRKVVPGIDDTSLGKLSNRVRNNGRIKKLLK